VENQYPENPAGDCGVSQIEYGPEKSEGFTTPKRKPLGPGGIDHREIEHVNNCTL
jgi:hypothetical protein